MQKWMPTDGTVQFENLTNSMGVLVISGPKARELMTRVSKNDFSNEKYLRLIFNKMMRACIGISNPYDL